jgi:hypothetical protein
LDARSRDVGPAASLAQSTPSGADHEVDVLFGDAKGTRSKTQTAVTVTVSGAEGVFVITTVVRLVSNELGPGTFTDGKLYMLKVRWRSAVAGIRRVCRLPPLARG